MTDSTAPLSVTQVADRLNVSPESVRRWIREGQLDAVLVGGAWRVLPEDVKAMIESGTRKRLDRYADAEYAVVTRPR
jgi:excisionase family DNA binding protein